jgi:hypothetical protein
MVGLVPLYAWSISASLPRDLWLTLLGFGAHTVAQAGFFGLRIIRQHGFTHSSDVVYFAVLVLWLYASRSRGREMTQGHPQPLSNRLCESER